MRIKIVRKSTSDTDVYYIYHGFRVILFPFVTKWMLDRTVSSEKAVLNYLEHFIGVSRLTIKVICINR